MSVPLFVVRVPSSICVWAAVGVVLLFLVAVAELDRVLEARRGIWVSL